jgi:prophage regulatory protein
MKARPRTPWPIAADANLPRIILSKEEAAAALSISASTLERLVRGEAFPRPRLLSTGRVGWLLRELIEWAEARPASDLLPPPNTRARKPRARCAP